MIGLITPEILEMVCDEWQEAFADFLTRAPEDLSLEEPPEKLRKFSEHLDGCEICQSAADKALEGFATGVSRVADSVAEAMTRQVKIPPEVTARDVARTKLFGPGTEKN